MVEESSMLLTSEMKKPENCTTLCAKNRLDGASMPLTESSLEGVDMISGAMLALWNGQLYLSDESCTSDDSECSSFDENTPCSTFSEELSDEASYASWTSKDYDSHEINLNGAEVVSSISEELSDEASSVSCMSKDYNGHKISRDEADILSPISEELYDEASSASWISKDYIGRETKCNQAEILGPLLYATNKSISALSWVKLSSKFSSKMSRSRFDLSQDQHISTYSTDSTKMSGSDKEENYSDQNSMYSLTVIHNSNGSEEHESNVLLKVRSWTEGLKKTWFNLLASPTNIHPDKHIYINKRQLDHMLAENTIWEVSKRRKLEPSPLCQIQVKTNELAITILLPKYQVQFLKDMSNNACNTEGAFGIISDDDDVSRVVLLEDGAIETILGDYPSSMTAVPAGGVCQHTSIDPKNITESLEAFEGLQLREDGECNLINTANELNEIDSKVANPDSTKSLKPSLRSRIETIFSRYGKKENLDGFHNNDEGSLLASSTSAVPASLLKKAGDSPNLFKNIQKEKQHETKPGPETPSIEQGLLESALSNFNENSLNFSNKKMLSCRSQVEPETRMDNVCHQGDEILASGNSSERLDLFKRQIKSSEFDSISADLSLEQETCYNQLKTKRLDNQVELLLTDSIESQPSSREFCIARKHSSLPHQTMPEVRLATKANNNDQGESVFFRGIMMTEGIWQSVTNINAPNKNSTVSISKNVDYSLETEEQEDRYTPKRDKYVTVDDEIHMEYIEKGWQKETREYLNGKDYLREDNDRDAFLKPITEESSDEQDEKKNLDRNYFNEETEESMDMKQSLPAQSTKSIMEHLSPGTIDDKDCVLPGKEHHVRKDLGTPIVSDRENGEESAPKSLAEHLSQQESVGTDNENKKSNELQEGAKNNIPPSPFASHKVLPEPSTNEEFQTYLEVDVSLTKASPEKRESASSDCENEECDETVDDKDRMQPKSKEQDHAKKNLGNLIELDKENSEESSSQQESVGTDRENEESNEIREGTKLNIPPSSCTSHKISPGSDTNEELHSSLEVEQMSLTQASSEELLNLWVRQ